MSTFCLEIHRDLIDGQLLANMECKSNAVNMSMRREKILQLNRYEEGKKGIAQYRRNLFTSKIGCNPKRGALHMYPICVIQSNLILKEVRKDIIKT